MVDPNRITGIDQRFYVGGWGVCVWSNKYHRGLYTRPLFFLIGAVTTDTTHRTTYFWCELVDFLCRYIIRTTLGHTHQVEEG